MDFAKDGKCETILNFELKDYPEIPCPEEIKPLVIHEIKRLCQALGAADKTLFSKK
jgi:hypothetical protein